MLVVSLFLNFRSCNKESDNYGHSTIVDNLKKEKDSIIQVLTLENDSLLLSIEKRDSVIYDAKNRIDSLKTVKDSVKIIYKKKYIEVESYGSSEIENYWKDEFER